MLHNGVKGAITNDTKLQEKQILSFNAGLLDSLLREIMEKWIRNKGRVALHMPLIVEVYKKAKGFQGSGMGKGQGTSELCMY